jgi:carboxypeptidase D
MRELDPDPFPYRFYEAYLNTPRVQAAIGAFTNFSGNNAVGDAFDTTGDDAREVGTIEALRSLICRGVTVALYAGDADYNCNWLGSEVVAAAVAAPGYAAAGYTDLRTSDGVVHGQVRQAGGFSFTRIYESGHEVPFYQPLAALEYFERAIKGLDLETGKRRVGTGYRTKGPQKSTYREGNGTVQYDVTPANLTYDPLTNKPGKPWPEAKAVMKRSFNGARGAGARPRSQSRFGIR